jgi:hypothetical protein
MVFVVGANQGRFYAAFHLPPSDLFVVEIAQDKDDLVAVVKAKDPTLLPAVQANLERVFAQRK